jgi:hypothetical protein
VVGWPARQVVGELKRLRRSVKRLRTRSVINATDRGTEMAPGVLLV